MERSEVSGRIQQPEFSHLEVTLGYGVEQERKGSVSSVGSILPVKRNTSNSSKPASPVHYWYGDTLASKNILETVHGKPPRRSWEVCFRTQIASEMKQCSYFNLRPTWRSHFDCLPYFITHNETHCIVACISNQNNWRDLEALNLLHPEYLFK